MRISKIPFYFVIASLFLPIIAAYTRSIYVTYFIDVFTLSLFSIFLILGKFTISKKYIALVLLPFFLYLSFNLFNGNGIGYKSLFSIILLTYIFLTYFKSSNNPDFHYIIFRQIKFIYVFLIAALFLEMILRIGGYDNLLFKPISTESLIHSMNPAMAEAGAVKLYKFYNAADFFKYVGFQNMTGLNSLLLGSQAASQIVANGIVIFCPFYYGSSISSLKDKYLLFLTCIVFYPFVATQTSNLILIIIFLIFLFILPNSKLKNVYTKLSFPLITISFIGLLPLILFRVSRFDDLKIYIDAWMEPINLWIKVNSFDKLFGLGDTVSGLLNSSDFGFGILFLSLGLIPFIFLLSLIFLLIIKTLSLIKISMNKNIIKDPWVYLGSVNIMCVIALFLSLFHYTQILELGGRHIFTFHLATGYICIEKIKKAIELEDLKENIFNS